MVIVTFPPPSAKEKHGNLCWCLHLLVVCLFFNWAMESENLEANGFSGGLGMETSLWRAVGKK